MHFISVLVFNITFVVVVRAPDETRSDLAQYGDLTSESSFMFTSHS